VVEFCFGERARRLHAEVSRPQPAVGQRGALRCARPAPLALRGRAGTPKRPALPDGWLDSRDLAEEATCALAEAELDHSGG